MRLAIILAALGAIIMLGRRAAPRVAPAPADDVDWLNEWRSA